MNLQIIFSRIFKIAGTLLVFLLISVTVNGQDYNYPPKVQYEMSSLKRLVLGIDDLQTQKNNEIKVLKNIDFETYVEREILIERWMHDRNLWMQGTSDLSKPTPNKDWMHEIGTRKLIDSDLGKLLAPEQEPRIELAEWMYSKNFIPANTDHTNMYKLERWMSDRSFWLVKK